MTILLCPDSFKGSMTALDFCDWSSALLKKLDPKVNVVSIPMSDGGEGSLAVLAPFLNSPRWINCYTVDALHRPVLTQYLTCGNKAYIELAKASGLPLIQPQERDLLKSNTFGTGLLIKHAFENGFTDIVLFCGGSATIDGGTGILQALGIRLLYKSGLEISNQVNALATLHSIENTSSFKPDRFRIVVDVKNPICGMNGAARVFGPQKGGSGEVLEKLDADLRHFSEILLYNRYPIDPEKQGLGAAGGVSLGLSLFSATLEFGHDYFVEATQLKKQLQLADIVITGEGRFDEQSTMGKITGTIIDLCSLYDKRCIMLCGSTENGAHPALELYTLCNDSERDDCMADPKLYLENTLARIFTK